MVTLSAHTGPVSAVVFNPTSADTLYSAGWDHSVRVWDIDSHVNVTTKVTMPELAFAPSYYTTHVVQRMLKLTTFFTLL